MQSWNGFVWCILDGARYGDGESILAVRAMRKALYDLLQSRSANQTVRKQHTHEENPQTRPIRFDAWRL